MYKTNLQFPIIKRPFRGKTNDALQQAILHDPVCFPEGHKISVQGIDFIKCLLTRDIKSRIGYGEQGFQRLMDHPWFEGIPWNKLETKEAEPPFAPDVKTIYILLLFFFQTIN